MMESSAVSVIPNSLSDEKNASPERGNASMQTILKWLIVTLLTLCCGSAESMAWGGRGHRTVAAIAMALIPEKAGQLNKVLSQLEMDNNFIDAASYPDEFVRSHDPGHKLSPWHYADLPDGNQTFVCGQCLFQARDDNLAILRAGKKDKAEAEAIAWVIHLVGDLHQPLHMSGRLRGGNDFHVTYRGKKECKLASGSQAKVELHSVWDDCLVEELAAGRSPQKLAKDLLGRIKTFHGRGEILPNNAHPWLAWGNDSHALANSAAFDSLSDGADLGDPYIKGPGKALDLVQHQLLVAGIRLAFLLDQNVK